LVVVTGCVIVAAAFLVGPGRGPRYKGRSLEGWLVVYGRAEDDEVRMAQAADAIRQIGTNAIPYLLANIRYDTPAWKARVGAVIAQLPGPLYGWWEDIVDRQDRSRQAYDGFVILGPQAAPAIPALVAMADNRYISDAPTSALEHIGKPALPYLVEALANRNNAAEMRGAAADALGRMGTNATAATDVLVSCLGDPGVEANVAYALPEVADPKTALQALTNALVSSSSRLRSCAAGSIANIGKESRAAIPALTICLDDEDEDVRRCASDTLSVIKARWMGEATIND
jgi:HEAT repeat protein